MITLAQALLVGGGFGVFRWNGPEVFEPFEFTFPGDAVPQLKLEIFPDGTLNFASRRSVSQSGFERNIPGTWLNQLNEKFGERVLVRLRHTSPNIYNIPWTSQNQWLSLNVKREFFCTNSAQPPATVSGIFTIDFAFEGSPEVVEFSAEQRYYLYRSL